MKTHFILPLCFIVVSLFSKPAQAQHRRHISERIAGQVSVALHFDSLSLQSREYLSDRFLQPSLHGFGSTMKPGLPMLPVWFDFILVPDTNATVVIHHQTTEVISGKAWPSPMLFPDASNRNPEFKFDSSFYLSSVTPFPSQPVMIDRFIRFQSQLIAVVRISPVQYQPNAEQFVFYRDLSYSIVYGNAFHAKATASQQRQLSGICMNQKAVSELPIRAINPDLPDYLILSHPMYTSAADSLAAWKSQLGYQVKTILNSHWTSASISDTIQQYYSRNGSDLRYVTLLGDHETVPGKNVYDSSAFFVSDLKYTCMDGPADYFPDLARGRISVNDPVQAMNVVLKIIGYERNPVSDPVFYSNAMACAYFQDDDDNTYADRRFAQTAEDIYQYMDTILGYQVNRVYYTESGTTPLYWNDGTYSNGENVPDYLRKPTFAWDGDYMDIVSAINSGRFLVWHRDHGYEDGWGDPAFSSSQVTALANSNKLPLIMSINCLTGKYLAPQCFSEVLLRKQNGGAVAVFGHADVSFSGYNDGLILGIVDAIFAVPGLNSVFTGSSDAPGTITTHPAYLELGDAGNQGLLRMTQTWGDNWGLEEYTYHLLQYFGDPSLRIFTRQPLVFTALSQPSLNCNDSSFLILSCSIDSVLATVVQNGVLLGKGMVYGGSANFEIQPAQPGHVSVTLSKPNTVPLVISIPVSGTCIHGIASVSPEYPCENQPVVFEAVQYGTASTWEWDFGLAASPQFATGPGPHQVEYTNAGNYPYTLLLSNGSSAQTIHGSVSVSSACTYLLTVNDTLEINQCSGFLEDNGAMYPYAPSQESVCIVRSPGATGMLIEAYMIDIPGGSGCSEDYLRIYSGEGTGGSLLGHYCNAAPFTTPLGVSNDVFTVVFHSNDHTQGQGFRIGWNCTSSNLPPQAAFKGDIIDECAGEVAFVDTSSNQPTAWLWDFGDGTTDSVSCPVHQYATAGIYTVSLIVSNAYGSDTIIKSAYLSIAPANTPSTTDAQRCNVGSLQLSASVTGAQLLWYDTNSSLFPVGTGVSFITPVLQSTCTYYVSSAFEEGSAFGGKANQSGAGGYFTSSNVHYMMFDVFEPLMLKSVAVYAGASGNRTFTITDNSGDIEWSGTSNLPAGYSRVNINTVLLPGVNYRLNGPGSPNLFRNGDPSGPTFPYPYDVGGKLQITGSSAGYPNTMRYYYYFYDWEVAGFCESARVPVEASIILLQPLTEWPDEIEACSGDTVMLQASGSDTYEWLPNGDTTSSVQVITDGVYSVVQSTDSCTVTSSQVSIIFLPSADTISFSYIVNGNDVIFTPSVTGPDLLWDFGDQSFSDEVSPLHSYTSSPYGHVVTLTAYSPCGTVSMNDTIEEITWISESGSHLMVNVYPVPAHDVLNIVNRGGGSISNAYLYEVSGRLIKSVSSDGDEDIQLKLSDISLGYYLLSVRMSDGQTINFSIIRQ